MASGKVYDGNEVKKPVSIWFISAQDEMAFLISNHTFIFIHDYDISTLNG